MSPTPDEYKCWIFGTAFLLYYIAQRWFGHRLQVTWLSNLARFYRLYALLCGTKSFTLALFLFLIAKDIYSMVENRVIEKLVLSRAVAQALDKPSPNEVPASANTQLLSWISEDAEDAWKQKMKACDARLQQSHDARAAFRTSTEEHSSLSDVFHEESSMFSTSTTFDISTPCPATRVDEAKCGSRIMHGIEKLSLAACCKLTEDGGGHHTTAKQIPPPRTHHHCRRHADRRRRRDRAPAAHRILFARPRQTAQGCTTPLRHPRPHPSLLSLSPPTIAFPATEAYLAPESASVDSCRLHPSIEGKLPLSPKTVEPSYEAWMPQDHQPQRPGNGLLIPKSQPRRCPPGAIEAAGRARRRPGYDLVPMRAPLKPRVALVPRWNGRFTKPARIIFSTSATLDGEDKAVGVGSSATKATEDAKTEQEKLSKQAKDALAMPPPPPKPQAEETPNPLLEMSNAAADEQVIEWLGTYVAMNEPLRDRCLRDINTIPNIAKVFKLWQEWVKTEGSWDFEKGFKTRMDEVLALVENTCRSLEDLSKMNDETRISLEGALLGATRMRDGLQWARQGN